MKWALIAMKEKSWVNCDRVTVTGRSGMLHYDVDSLLQTRYTGSIHWNPLSDRNCPGVIKDQAAGTGRLKKEASPA